MFIGLQSQRHALALQTCSRSSYVTVTGLPPKNATGFSGETTMSAVQDTCLSGSDDYDKEFDAKQYLHDCYQLDQSNKDGNAYLVKYIKLLHDIFSGGKYKGQTLLEIGAGPTIHSIISASKHYEQIVTSDYVKGSREEIKKWRNNEPDSFDWNPIIQMVCDLEGNGETAKERAEMLRGGIVDVAFCDISQDPMLPSQNGATFDAIVVISVITAVAIDEESRQHIMSRIVKYLKPGGFLFLGETLGSTFYRRGASGDRAFSNYNTSREDVISSLKNLGTNIIHESLLGLPGDGHHNDCTDRIFVVAQKS